MRQHEASQHPHHRGTRKKIEREQGIKNLLNEIMTENFSNLVEKKTHKPRNPRETQTR